MKIQTHFFPLAAVMGVLTLMLTGCHTPSKPGAFAPRRGDEIVAAGQFFHTGARVVLWMDPGGYDAYRVERRFSNFDDSSWETSKTAVKDLTTPNRYGLRKSSVLTSNDVERVRGGGWDLPLLQQVVDQFVIHYDAAGTSRQCFKILHDLRDLSVHFLLDLDGTIYQTLDLKERAWHATSSNTRSVGIEIAHIGAFSVRREPALKEWYQADERGGVKFTVPSRFGPTGVRTPNFVARPARAEAVRGVVQGSELVQYDFTPEQYKSLAKLTATLCKVFPKIECDYPRDADGKLILKKLPDEQLARYQGVLGHFHIQLNKVDPGPAFQWDHVVAAARALLRGPPPARPRWSDRTTQAR
ncbi:MAG: N-acetylmuramoyl-L-alanine amidase [Verrucomicrobia bacterium]|nr:N-acetylmuramoyl-L-alanine amidase [Verrucomicrobiota bacterium]